MASYALVAARFAMITGDPVNFDPDWQWEQKLTPIHDCNQRRSLLSSDRHTYLLYRRGEISNFASHPVAGAVT